MTAHGAYRTVPLAQHVAKAAFKKPAFDFCRRQAALVERLESAVNAYIGNKIARIRLRQRVDDLAFQTIHIHDDPVRKTKWLVAGEHRVQIDQPGVDLAHLAEPREHCFERAGPAEAASLGDIENSKGRRAAAAFPDRTAHDIHIRVAGGRLAKLCCDIGLGFNQHHLLCGGRIVIQLAAQARTKMHDNLRPHESPFAAGSERPHPQTGLGHKAAYNPTSFAHQIKLHAGDGQPVPAIARRSLRALPPPYS